MVVRFASYNTALSRPHSGALLAALKSGKDKQVLATIALLQEVRPDIILLNEVDFDASGETAKLLQSLLRQPSSTRTGLDYPSSFVSQLILECLLVEILTKMGTPLIKVLTR
jgi:hypothetical protein